LNISAFFQKVTVRLKAVGVKLAVSGFACWIRRSPGARISAFSG